MSIPFTWVYLIYDPFTRLFKIGRSDNPEARYKQLVNPSNYGTIPAAPCEYELLEAWLCVDNIEQKLHCEFAEWRVRGEWFDLFDAWWERPDEAEPIRVLEMMCCHPDLKTQTRLYRPLTHEADMLLATQQAALDWAYRKLDAFRMQNEQLKLTGGVPLALPVGEPILPIRSLLLEVH